MTVVAMAFVRSAALAVIIAHSGGTRRACLNTAHTPRSRFLLVGIVSLQKRSDDMGVFRVNKNRNYTVMSNVHLRDKALPLKAKGLLSLMLSLPEDWDYSMRGLAKLSADGLDSTRAAVKALERSGYVVRRQLYDSRGRFSNNEYTVFEIPQSSSPSSDLPLTGKPSTEKPPSDAPLSGKPSQINTEQVITQERNTDLNNYQSINLDGMDRMDERERYREIIEENIEYEIMKDRPDGDRLGEIVEIMLDAVCSTAPTIRINGEDMPQQVVKSRFLKLDSSHIEYVFHAMKECPSNIRNIRAYLLTTLYNAPATMDNFYSAKVNHDFNGW
jgi:hypothetical protein